MGELRECSDCGRLVPDPHADHDCDGAELLDPEAHSRELFLLDASGGGA